MTFGFRSILLIFVFAAKAGAQLPAVRELPPPPPPPPVKAATPPPSEVPPVPAIPANLTPNILPKTGARTSTRKTKAAKPQPVVESKPVKPPMTEALAREAFKKGVDAFQHKQFDTAAAALVQVPELGGYLSLYKHWFLGQAYLELGKYKEAEPEFAKVTQAQASSELKYQAQFNLGETALRQKKYNESIARLQPLERKWRHSYRFPEVLYRLMIAELRLNRTASACKRARKLYAKFPAHSSVMSWGNDLQMAEVDGKKLPCAASKDDFSERVRSLQWAGENEKAHKELTDLLAKVPESERVSLDMTLANFLVNEGSVDDALNLLVRYYPQQKSNLNFLTLLGKAAARSGEYQTAVGAYERAYSLNPNTKKGREALFQAAYLSYQFQDYDGAVRKFQQFSKRNPNSGLARDAQWHLAWLQYLRSDYHGALEKFAKAGKVSRRRRGQSDSLQERLLYWTAMAHIRLNELGEARTAFETILSHNKYSYYGLAAQARLDIIKPKIDESKPHVALTIQMVPNDSEPEAPVEAQESEEGIVENPDEEVTVAQESEEGDEDRIQASEFKDPALRARIDIAQKLIQLGLPELARWELIEVEKRTRNRQYLRMLISAYEGITSYHRSASIAELNFVKERENGGLDGAGSLWTAMYPQAFKTSVLNSSKRFSVPQEWIWAIMRTESLYKTDVISPVGAKGLMQLMPFTARNLYRLNGEVTPDNLDLLNPETNIRLGAQYLGRLMQKFNGQLALVAAAYNAGPHRVESWLVSFGHLETDEFVEHIPFLETRNYVKKVVRSHTLYRRIYAKDQKSVDSLAKVLGVPIPSRAATRESWENL